MAVVTAILGTVESLRGKIESEDPVLLNSEERASAHLAGRSQGGRSVRVSLPRGTEINDGDVLALDGTTAVVARAAPEALYVISPGDAYTWGVAGYQLGNLHRPVRFTGDGMLTPADPMVADLLTRLGIAFEERTTPFVGRRYGAHGADHHHHDPHRDHPHDHRHDHPHDRRHEH